MTDTIRSSQGPFCFIQPSVRDASILFVLALIPQLFMLWLTGSYQSLILIGVTVFASLFSECADNLKHKRKTLNDGTAIVEGLIAGMFLPSSYPVVPAFFITLAAFFAAKQLFGGLASSWANPPIVAVAAAYGFGASWFPGFLIPAQAAQAQDLCAYLFQSGAVNYLPADAGLTSLLNTAFSPLGITIPDGYVTLFWDSQSIIPAFRFNILTLCASLFFIAAKLGNWIIPLCFLTVYAFLVRFFSLLPFTGVAGQGDMLVALLTGGILFTAFFVLSWYGTIPFSLAGQICYGFLAGAMAFLLNGYGTSPVGAVFVVLIMNMVSPLIQLFERSIYIWLATLKVRRKVQNEQ